MKVAKKLAISAAVVAVWWFVMIFVHNNFTTLLGDTWSYRYRDEASTYWTSLYEPTVLSVVCAMLLAALFMAGAVYIFVMLAYFVLKWWDWIIDAR